MIVVGAQRKQERRGAVYAKEKFRNKNKVPPLTWRGRCLVVSISSVF